MKKVNFSGKPSGTSSAGNVDDWVMNREVANREPMKRLTIDVPISLHKRIKSQCALENLVMADVIRELLEQRLPRSQKTRRKPTDRLELHHAATLL